VDIIEGQAVDSPQEPITVVDHRLPPFVEMTPGVARYCAAAVEAFAEANRMEVRDGEVTGDEAATVLAQSEDAAGLVRYLRSWANAWDPAGAA
jgi:hypothetical protein